MYSMAARSSSSLQFMQVPQRKMVYRLSSQTPPLKADTDQGDSEDHPEQNGGAYASQND
jgi:hypothetical protein